MAAREEGDGRLEVHQMPAGGDAFDAFLSLRSAGRDPFILETLGPPGSAVVGFDPAGSVRRSRGEARVRMEERVLHSTDLRARRGALETVESILHRFRRAPAPSGLPFTGGFVGFFSYEWSAAQEGPDGERERGVPDLWFGLYDRALVFSPGRLPLLVVDRAVRGLSRVETETVAIDVERVTSPTRLDLRSTAFVGAPGPAQIKSDFRRQDFEVGVREVRRHIRRGDVYQANIAHRMRARGVDAVRLYAGLRRANPSPFMGVMDCGGFEIVSGSPERLVEVRPQADGTRLASTRPIAGTRPRGRGAADETMERRLRASVKERAEHVMLVDLERNDLGRVSEPGSVEVDELLSVERYSHVMHLVSNVTARLRDDVTLADLARAMLPGGTVTGCPKIRAMEVIREIEPVPRGAYTGSMGYLSFDGRIDLNILIRSAYFPRNTGECHVFAGAGIVQDSRPGREWEETLHKAQAILEVLGAPGRRGRSWEPPRRLASWRPPAAERSFPGARVLVIDNYDSFTYNLVQYVAAAGAGIEVVRNDEKRIGELVKREPTHVIISPGPGIARESGVSIEAVKAFEGTPILGVCLGLQAIVEAYGGRVAEAPVPVHGKSSVVRRAPPRQGLDILSALPREFEGGRYHSLAAVKVKAPIEVTAVTRSGVVMAVRHREAPTFGVQFHPESVLTPAGMRIIQEFLRLRSDERMQSGLVRASLQRSRD